jgi:DNA polymerase-3 subunit delta
MGCFACYEDKNENIYQILRGMGMTFEPAAIQLLCSKLSNDRMVNLMELDKLATYMGDAKNVTPDVISKIISDASNSSTEDICYAALEGDKAKAVNYYNKYINEGNDAVSVVRTIMYHFMKLLVCQADIENGETVDKAMQRLMPKVIFYREDSFKKQLTAWRRDKILKALELLYEAERDCKTTDMPAQEIVSMTILKLTAAVRR